MPQLIASVEGVEVERVYLKKERTTLGRKPYNDIVLHNLVVSGEHCVFALQGLTDVTIEDLGSTNGTYVNGHMIKSREALKDRDIITIGNFRVQYLTTSASEPTGAPQATKAMTLDALGLPGTPGVLQACFKTLSGDSAGLELPLLKAVTTFGQPGVARVSVSHRRDGYYVARIDGETAPTLNGQAIGHEAVVLAHNDVLELAGVAMAFLLSGK
jgi:FHA domain